LGHVHRARQPEGLAVEDRGGRDVVGWDPDEVDAAHEFRGGLGLRVLRGGAHRFSYAFLITMPSRMKAARSVESIAFSSRSKMSFQRITTIGSIPLSNSDAIASRTSRSPSFSSRCTSTI